MKKLLMCGAVALMMMGVANVAEAGRAQLRFGSGEVCTYYDGKADALVGKLGEGQHLYVRWIGETYGVGQDGAGYESVVLYPVDEVDRSFQEQFEVDAESASDDNGWYHFIVPYSGPFAIVDSSRSQGAMDGYRVDVCAFDYAVGSSHLPEE